MPMPIKVTGQRVKKDTHGCKPVDGMGCVMDTYPEDGYLFQIHLPGAPAVYVRDSDIQGLTSSEGAEVALLAWEGAPE